MYLRVSFPTEDFPPFQVPVLVKFFKAYLTAFLNSNEIYDSVSVIDGHSYSLQANRNKIRLVSASMVYEICDRHAKRSLF